MNIPETVAAQKEYFRSGATLPADFRRDRLRKLLDALYSWEKPLCDALMHDLHKSPEEAYMTEISMVRGEIRNQLAHLRSRMRRRLVPTPLAHFPCRGYEVMEPLGTVLIVSPWNYPVQLLLSPLAGAIAAGCTAVLKTSPSVPEVSSVLRSMIEECFAPEYVAVVEGHREVNTELFAQRFDLVFLTGSPALGKIAMKAAAEHLTPVVLELGGKSPCVVDRDADLKTAARRIAWGKTLNAGQTCIAPDYLLLHEDIKEAFIEAFRQAVAELHGSDAATSRHFARIVSDKAWKRLVSYLSQGEIVAGGHHDAGSRYIEPTLLDGVDPDSPVMQEEIFGPVFPIITWRKPDDAVDFVLSREKPLALYYFGNERRGWEFARRCSSGGACINDCIMHIVNDRLPFGGVGNSGMGSYHGRYSFEAFSHRRAVVVTPTWTDLPFRYMPYRFIRLIRRILR